MVYFTRLRLRARIRCRGVRCGVQEGSDRTLRTDPKNNSDYSRIISPKAVERLAGLIDQKKVIAGGASDPKARYIDPTILYPVTWDDPIMEVEIFGPLLPILTYKDIDE